MNKSRDLTPEELTERRREYNRRYRERHPERVREAKKRWNATPSVKASKARWLEGDEPVAELRQQPVLLTTEPNPELIANLEELLEDAKAGRLLGVFAFVNKRGGSGHMRSGYWTRSDILWAVECWKFGMLQKAFAEDEQV